MSEFDHLETPLDEPPLFPVEEPDGRKDLSEIKRCIAFRKLVRELAPGVFLYANANAGKRNPRQAIAEGIVGGAFDYTAAWSGPKHGSDRTVCWLEFKGYSKAGQPGQLSQAQIDFGNRLHRMGHRVACVFRPETALRLLASYGAPVRERVG